MDAELQSALRWLGRGFHAGRFDTVELLKAIGIKHVYIVTGMFTGVFLDVNEIWKAVEAHCVSFDNEEAKAIQDWLADPNRKPSFMQHMREASIWDAEPWEQKEGGAYLHIRELNLEDKGLPCCGNKANTHLSDFMMMRETCECGERRCINHMMFCSVCEAACCISCVIINDKTVELNHDFMCYSCAEEADVLEDEEEEIQGLTDLVEQTPPVADNTGTASPNPSHTQ